MIFVGFKIAYFSTKNEDQFAKKNFSWACQLTRKITIGNHLN